MAAATAAARAERRAAANKWRRRQRDGRSRLLSGRVVAAPAPAAADAGGGAGPGAWRCGSSGGRGGRIARALRDAALDGRHGLLRSCRPESAAVR